MPLRPIVGPGRAALDDSFASKMLVTYGFL